MPMPPGLGTRRKTVFDDSDVRRFEFDRCDDFVPICHGILQFHNIEGYRFLND
jgi:hypothetical protein